MILDFAWKDAVFRGVEIRDMLFFGVHRKYPQMSIPAPPPPLPPKQSVSTTVTKIYIIAIEL